MTKNPFRPARAWAVFARLVLSAAVTAIAPRAFAQATPNPPDRLAYQGYLVDANGNPLGPTAPKNYDVIFRIWNDPTGGSLQWAEQQTVTVDKGYFSVVLGEGSSIGETRPALSTIFANASASERWIGLTVKGIAAGGADANLLPRLRLVTSPYAFLATKATMVDGAGVTSGTVPDARLSPNVALRGSPNTFTGHQIIMNGNVGIGTASPDRPLTVRASGSNGEWLSLKDVADVTRWQLNNEASGLNFMQTGVSGNRLFLANDGNVGIGINSPQAKLHVAGGNLRLDSGARIQFEDNGEIRSADDNHRILFRRSENKMELREFGDIIFSPGANAGTATAKAVLLASGNMGIGTSIPQAKLHVAGAGNFLGSNPYVKFSDEKAKGTAGGTATAGGQIARTFNTKYDPMNVAPFFAPGAAITLPAGTYQCRISVPAFRVNFHQARLRIPGGPMIFGTSAFADANDGGDVTSSTISGQFTLPLQNSLAVDHYTASGKSGDGLGIAVNANWTDGSPVEVYTVAEFWKLQ